MAVESAPNSIFFWNEVSVKKDKKLIQKSVEFWQGVVPQVVVFPNPHGLGGSLPKIG
jgi:hypothetical protein